MAQQSSYTPMTPDDVADAIGQGLHTGLRKGCEDGMKAWEAISDMPDDDWSAALRFLVSGLDSMGLVLCERHDA